MCEFFPAGIRFEADFSISGSTVPNSCFLFIYKDTEKKRLRHNFTFCNRISGFFVQIIDIL